MLKSYVPPLASLVTIVYLGLSATTALALSQVLCDGAVITSTDAAECLGEVTEGEVLFEESTKKT